ncbi:MAG: hypothetical protein QOG20_1804 [Pseudonocardiales bacterium]|jgi:sugar diacid utilization regulator|nr:hypothetical protein [Pseudonocardiales bacterium]
MDDDEVVSALREQLSKLSSVFALSMTLFDRTAEPEILSLAVSSVAALGPCRAEGTYLVPNQSPGPASANGQIDDQLTALGGVDGPVALPHREWGWAYPLRAVGGHSGYLVVSADVTPTPDERFLLTTLAQQTGAALHSAALHRSEREQGIELRELNERLAVVNDQLKAAVADLEGRGRIHELLTEAAASGGGEAGIAAVLHDLTGLAVAVEDQFGNLRAWGGPDRPTGYPRPAARQRGELLTEIRRNGRPTRHRERLLALAQSRDQVLGVLALVDPGHRAGPHELFALEHGAVVLAMELTHLRGLAETELRLRGDLVEDLLSGADDDSALLRATALGHDLSRPHQVLVIAWKELDGHDGLARAVARAATRVLDTGALLGRRAGDVVLVAHRPETWGELDRWNDLHRAVAATMRSGDGAIGVGRPCSRPSELPRSYKEALRALRIRKDSASPYGVTTFAELGIYRLLAAGGDDREVGEYVHEWLGPLIGYDAANHSDLVTTLWQYYECGGNYDATAHALLIHRSTLRYRLRRIRELTGHDLGDVETRLNLHVAARAWQVLRGSS